MLKMKELPNNERPRERLISFGVEKLSNEELISIILKTGTKSRNVKELSFDILKEYKEISNLKSITISKLKNIKGIGSVKAIELVATVELGRRIFLTNQVNNKKRLITPKDIWLETRYLFNGKKQEYFYTLYFNNKQELLSKKLLFIGTINKSIVHPREVFKEAYLLSASSIICIHNHPSGDVTPSLEDKIFTNNLKEIGKIQKIPLLDHIIVSEDKYYSFYDYKNI